MAADKAIGLRRAIVAATTWWPAPARLASAFAGEGVDVVAICPAGHPLRRTRAVSRLVPYKVFGSVAALGRAVTEHQPDLLVACDDRAAEHCALLAGKGPEWIDFLLRRSLGDPRHYPEIFARSRILEIAAGEGVRVPETIRLSPGEELPAGRMPFPWVVKSSGSWGGAGVRIVGDRAAARRAIAGLARPIGASRALKRLVVNRDGFWIPTWLNGQPPEIIVQAHVKGEPANIAFACCDGELLSSIAVRVLQSQGATGPASIAEVIENPEMVEAARKLARRLRLSGFHGIDFMLDPDGRAWMIEMNPRATQLCHYAAEGGVSLAGAMVRFAETGSAPEANPAPGGTRIAFFPQAWRADPANPLLRGAAHDVPWEEPDLVADLLLPPWPNRGALARLWQRMVGSPDANAAWAGASAAAEATAPVSAAVPAEANLGGRVHPALPRQAA